MTSLEVYKELESLVALAKDERASLVNEIVQQAVAFDAFFWQMLGLSPSATPSTIKLIELTRRVAEMVGMHFKAKFNRARPSQLFPALLPLLTPPGHPSYPSGHSLESHMVALALGDLLPSRQPELTALADRISRNRQVAGLHFQSDTDAGIDIANQAFPLLQCCPTYKSVLASAQKEPLVP